VPQVAHDTCRGCRAATIRQHPRRHRIALKQRSQDERAPPKGSRDKRPVLEGSESAHGAQNEGGSSLLWTVPGIKKRSQQRQRAPGLRAALSHHAQSVRISITRQRGSPASADRPPHPLGVASSGSAGLMVSRIRLPLARNQAAVGHLKELRAGGRQRIHASGWGPPVNWQGVRSGDLAWADTASGLSIKPHGPREIWTARLRACVVVLFWWAAEGAIAM